MREVQKMIDPQPIVQVAGEAFNAALAKVMANPEKMLERAGKYGYDREMTLYEVVGGGLVTEEITFQEFMD